jgi:hypothetical protein
MPNWTDNTLTIIVPKDRQADFLAAIEGPADWAIPAAAFHDFEQSKIEISNHLRLQIADDGPGIGKIISDFHAHMAPQGWPDWMKPSRKDLEVFLADPEKPKADVVPFSVAKLNPWTDQEEFASYFPDEDPDSPVWVPKTGKSDRSSPIIDLRHHKIGPKWPPGSIELDVDDTDPSHTRIEITYQTPWSPLSDICGLLENVCKAHNARFLLTWVEEQGYCGYSYCNPAEDVSSEEEWDTEHSWYEAIEDEDDEYQSFDRIAFSEAISEMIDDPVL